MEFSKVVERRYSCKRYDGRKVEEDKLQRMLNAARMAPTAKNQQEYHIYIVESEEGLKKVDACTPCRYNAGMVAVFTYVNGGDFTYPGGKQHSGMEDATIVATHFMLAAANEDVETCWLNFFDPDLTRAELGLPENETVVLMLDVGYAAPEGKPLANHFDRKSLDETVTRI